MLAASATNVNAEFVRARAESALESAENRGGDAGGMPVHAHNGAERLEPEWIAQAREEFRRAVVIDDAFRDRCAEFRHALGQPRRDASAVERKIG